MIHVDLDIVCMARHTNTHYIVVSDLSDGRIDWRTQLVDVVSLFFFVCSVLGHTILADVFDSQLPLRNDGFDLAEEQCDLY